MNERKTRRRSGGPPVGLTRDAILRAADAFDVDDLSMPALASSLGVSHGALYHYFPSKKALVDALAESALENVRLPDAGDRDWRELVLEAASAWHEVLLTHSHYLPYRAASVGAASVAITERILTALLDVGCSQVRAAQISARIFAWCLYSAVQHAYNEEHDLHTDEQLHGYLDSIGAAADSAMRVLPHYYSSRSREQIFRDGIEAIIETAGP